MVANLDERDRARGERQERGAALDSPGVQTPDAVQGEVIDLSKPVDPAPGTAKPTVSAASKPDRPSKAPGR